MVIYKGVKITQKNTLGLREGAQKRNKYGKCPPLSCVAMEYWIAENFAGLPGLEPIHRYWASRKPPSKVQVGQSGETDFWDTCGLIGKTSIGMAQKLEKPFVRMLLKLDRGSATG